MNIVQNDNTSIDNISQILRKLTSLTCLEFNLGYYLGFNDKEINNLLLSLQRHHSLYNLGIVLISGGNFGREYVSYFDSEVAKNISKVFRSYDKLSYLSVEIPLENSEQVRKKLTEIMPQYLRKLESLTYLSLDSGDKWLFDSSMENLFFALENLKLLTSLNFKNRIK